LEQAERHQIGGLAKDGSTCSICGNNRIRDIAGTLIDEPMGPAGDFRDLELVSRYEKPAEGDR